MPTLICIELVALFALSGCALWWQADGLLVFDYRLDQRVSSKSALHFQRAYSGQIVEVQIAQTATAR